MLLPTSYLIYFINCFLLSFKIAKVKISDTTTYNKLAKNSYYIWLGSVRTPCQYMGGNIFELSIVLFITEVAIYYNTFIESNVLDNFLFIIFISVSLFSKYYDSNIFKIKNQKSLTSYYVKKLVRDEKILIVGGGPATNILTLLQDINKIIKFKYDTDMFECSISNFSDKITIFAQQFTMYPEMNLTGQQVNTSCDETSAFKLVEFCNTYNLDITFIGTSANKWNDKSVNVNKVTDWSKVMNSYHRDILQKQFNFVGPSYATSGIMFDPVTYLFAINYIGTETGFLPEICNVYAYLDDMNCVRISKEKRESSYPIKMMKPLWEQPDSIISIMTDRKEKSDFVEVSNDITEITSKLEDQIIDVMNGSYKIPNDFNVITIGDGITGDLDDIIMYLCALGSSNKPISIIYTTAPCDPSYQQSFNPKEMKIKDYLTKYINSPSACLGKIRGYNLAKEIFLLLKKEVKRGQVNVCEGRLQAKKHPFGGLASFHCEKRITNNFELIASEYFK